MFDGLQRRAQKTLDVMGLRIRYTIASGAYTLQIAAERCGAIVANNIDLILSGRGTGIVRTAGNMRVGTGGTLFFEDGNGWITRTAGSNSMSFSAASNTSQLSIQSTLLTVGPGATSFTVFGLSAAGAAGTFGIEPTARAGNTGVGHITQIRGGAGSTATTGSSGGAVLIAGGASNGTAANIGGDVFIVGGAPSSTAARGTVKLGTDGTAISRVTVRNTILGLNGYTTTAAAATTTELPTAGDLGIHKNSSSGSVHLCFNDGGTIKSVQLV